MATATISSALISSDQPGRIRDWYAHVFDATVEHVGGDPGYDVVDLDGFYLMVDSRDDVSGPAREPARLILNLEVDDIGAVSARIDDLGHGWLAPVEDRDGSWFGTATDPDGNFVQIIALSDAMVREAQEASTTPFSGFSVADIDAAETFYRDVLRLRVTATGSGMLAIHLDRRTRVLVYPSADHRPASFTVLNIPVPDIDAAVADLVSRGVTFARYEGLPCDDKGIMRGRSVGMGPDIAWFTDPAGNVLSVLH